jgi:hypothetical protein
LRSDPEHPFSEVVGVVASIDDRAEVGPTLSVVRRSGEIVTVPLGDVTDAKVFGA